MDYNIQYSILKPIRPGWPTHTLPSACSISPESAQSQFKKQVAPAREPCPPAASTASSYPVAYGGSRRPALPTLPAQINKYPSNLLPSPRVLTGDLTSIGVPSATCTL